MEVSQKFTEKGRWGVAFFVLGPIAFSISLWLVISDGGIASSGLGVGYIPLVAVSIMATFAGIPLMMTGRKYDVKITHIPRDSFK